MANEYLPDDARGVFDRDAFEAECEIPAETEGMGCDDITRRGFVQALGAGVLISVMPATASAQWRRRRGGRSNVQVAARVHIGKDGAITVMTGKVEGGQGARTELTQAAAEELRVPLARIQLVMGDTRLVPDDGITAGSRTTPSTVPAVRQGCAAARNLLAELAGKRWGVAAKGIEVRDGKVVHATLGKELAYADLAASDDAAKAFGQMVPADVAVTSVKEWKILGVSTVRTNARDLVTGRHRYPSDIVREGMLYGKVLRAPSYGATLKSIDLAPARAMKGVVAVQDGEFVGVVAPTTFAAQQALDAIAKTAVWTPAPHPSSKEVYDYLKRNARGGIPKNPFADELAKAAKVLRQEYHVAYVQHAPLEPRAAVAEWQDGNLTVWASTQNPFGHRSELMRTFRLGSDRVRVIVPDFGAGFGGKHTGEASVEAARLARAAKRPVSLRWTRREEFTWAYFRPAAVIDVEAGLDAGGRLTSWYFVNVNSGGAAIDTPYRVGSARSRYVSSEPALRQGSYRALAATANNFARECFMDELAGAAGRDPLEFRLAHLDNQRIRAVLDTAADRFDWKRRAKKKDPNIGVGLACGTEKGSVVAACAEIAVDRPEGRIHVRHVCEVFECGAVLNPNNMRSQVMGCILMGLGPALREEIEFEGGRITNGSFGRYPVPRFKDVPELDIHLLERPDLDSVGGGETPIMVIAPAIANAVFHATGLRIHAMPIRLPKA
jgi:CO/xanthine dehydrogenase Mo-binding subunit